MSKAGKESFSMKKNVSQVSSSSVKKKTSKSVVEKTGAVKITEFRSLNVGDMRSSLQKQVGGGVSDASITSSVSYSENNGGTKNVKASKSKVASKRIDGANFVTTGATVVKAKFESDSKNFAVAKGTSEKVVAEQKIFGNESISASENVSSLESEKSSAVEGKVSERVGASIDDGTRTEMISFESNGTSETVSSSKEERVTEKFFQMSQKSENVALVSDTTMVSGVDSVEVDSRKSGSDVKFEKSITQEAVFKAHSEKSTKISTRNASEKMSVKEKKIAASFTGEQCICEICTCG